MIANLLVCFQSGARGDFLASMLLGRKIQHKLVQQPPQRLYTKAHHIDRPDAEFSVAGQKIKNYFGVRVKLHTLNDFIKVVYLKQAKGLETHWYNPGTLSMVADEELLHRQHDDSFKFIFDCAYIDDLDYIQNFYKQCCEKELSGEMIQAIAANIDLHKELFDQRYQAFVDRFSSRDIDYIFSKFSDQSI